MGKRLGRLQHAQEFSAVFGTRPAGSVGPFSVHVHPPVNPTAPYIRVGFVLPKRFLKKAVYRNQIKRWTKEALREASDHPSAARHVLVRLKRALDVADWPKTGRRLARTQLLAALQAALGRQTA